MEEQPESNVILGINGLGRIGKLLLWNSVQRKYFKKIVVNIGRPAGTSLADLAHYVERDSTYGRLHTFLHGNAAQPVITEINEAEKTMRLDGVGVQFLQSARNPRDIAWAEHDVRLVADTTGVFLDPAKDPDEPGGSARGHLLAGADKVVVSAPFKLKHEGAVVPEDAVTTVMGINDSAYDPRRHRIVSNASCTTTCLAHMFKPLLNAFGADRILTASMATVHAATGSQQVLDRLPGAKKTDLRKNRSILNNIILTSTGAAKALIQVIPEMSRIGFLAESVRIPTAAGSLIILVVNIQEKMEGGFISREGINEVYQTAEKSNPLKYLRFSEKQNVSSDIMGWPQAAVVIEGHETHTRRAEVAINLKDAPGLDQNVIAALKDPVVRVPMTKAVIYGWYDNEMGSYVGMLGRRCVSVARSL